jgi:hypothetical protein
MLFACSADSSIACIDEEEEEEGKEKKISEHH